MKKRSSKPRSSTEDILEEALRITSGERQSSHGDFTTSLENIAKVWSVLLDKQIDGRTVANLMIAFKTVRASMSQKRDDWVDMAGYARGGSLCEEKKELDQS